MYFHHNNRLAWLSIAKNACRSWAQVFDDLGWIKEDLYQPQVDIAQLEFFGLLRWPDIRHTMGVIEYLEQTDQLSLLHNVRFRQLLVSAVFDQHSYTVSHMIPVDIVERTTWFIMYQSYYNYEVLVRNYLHSHGVEIAVPVPRITTSRPSTDQSRIDLTRLKQQWPEDHARLIKNFLDADAQLYKQHLALQSQWHRPGDPGLGPIKMSEFYPWLPTEDWIQS
jgi:hypothetical protein